ncbi:type III-A CRISPR-associated RAMP protein Csm3 [Desulfonema magnum]|uniref:CRISPR system Cms endoribonuclease Csm3 n=1 Tax=Desulfonema magnum TaxID=45655 RepID=A0A975BUP6_9BACT|nr:type III-A CRISPR-associated RAMP protein Csm3 [Desulfonema magnum]QTA91973.1 CRISPR type III-A/MTUBE-associated RAMP protein [Desulfonema magnum]
MQQGTHFRYLFGNVFFRGKIVCKSGLHIGGSSDVLEIGGIDSFVIRNPVTNEPYIPGSSLKGKLRSTVEKIVTVDGVPLMANRKSDKDGKVWRHECDDFTNAKDCPLCRIFGASGKESKNNNYPTALLFRDGKLANPEKLKDEGMPIFEAKTENTLDRLTSAAHPRTIERVPAGAEFDFEMVYRVEMLGKVGEDTAEKLKSPVFPNLQEDISNILKAMSILEHDGLGGNISRGYGQIQFDIDFIKGLRSDGSEIVKIEKPEPEEPVKVGQGIQLLPDFAKGFADNYKNGGRNETRQAEV